MKPRARREGLIVRELPEEVLVYDRQRHQAHCLNPAAALVFKHADGRRDAAQLAHLLREDLGIPADERWVHLAVEDLRRAHLLATPEGAEPRSPSRRRMLKRLGVAAATLPAVASVLAPTPAEAANTCIQGSNCPGNDGQPCYDVEPGLGCAGNGCYCNAGQCEQGGIPCPG
jgi:hypothetical protein